MLRQIIFLATMLFLASCREKQQGKQNETIADITLVDSIVVLNDPKSNLNIQTNSFLEIDSSGILMFPLSMGESERDGSRLSYKEMPGNSFWNIIFLNSRTNEYHLLSDKKMLIRSYDFKYNTNGNVVIAQTSRHIFYSITCDDFNKDRKLTDEDPKYLFISDKEGNNFRQISPSNYDLQNWQFIKSVNKVLFIVRKDSDKNSKFDDNDEAATFEVDIDKETESKEVFSTDFKSKLKILYDRDWKRLKK